MSSFFKTCRSSSPCQLVVAPLALFILDTFPLDFYLDNRPVPVVPLPLFLFFSFCTYTSTARRIFYDGGECNPGLRAYALALYSVHTPPLRSSLSVSHPARFPLVRSYGSRPLPQTQRCVLFVPRTISSRLERLRCLTYFPATKVSTPRVPCNFVELTFRQRSSFPFCPPSDLSEAAYGCGLHFFLNVQRPSSPLQGTLCQRRASRTSHDVYANPTPLLLRRLGLIGERFTELPAVPLFSPTVYLLHLPVPPPTARPFFPTVLPPFPLPLSSPHGSCNHPLCRAFPYR